MVKEGKQAEFLVHDFFAIGHFDLVGVRDAAVLVQATNALKPVPNPPAVQIRPDWYY